MAPKSKDETPRRLNRAVSAGEALGRVLDPAFKKRGFASRDLMAHWGAMAPKPYDAVAQPDRLTWPRGDRGAEGATLYVRIAAGHALALAHEGERIAASINRYFGYFLIGGVRQSAMPFVPGDAPAAVIEDEASADTQVAVGDAVSAVKDEGLKDALRRLGHKVVGRT